MLPIGRWHAESRGLLLLTNDNSRLANQLTHPRFGAVDLPRRGDRPRCATGADYSR